MADTNPTIFNDTFTEDTNTTLASHTPDTGTSWTVVQQYNSNTLRVNATNDNIEPTTADFSTGATYTADVTYDSADYHVQVDTTTTQGGDEWQFLIARYQDTSNTYLARWGDDLSSDPVIYSRSGASNSSLITWDNSDHIPYSSGDTVIFEVIGSDLALFTNEEVAYLYASNSDHTSAGKGGLGMGAHWMDTGGDTSPRPKMDNFKVIEIGADNSGWKSPTTTGETDNDFTSPSNAYSSDGSDTTANAVNDAQDYGDFTMGVTAGATIYGIQVMVEGNSDTFGSETLDVALSWDNGSTWTTAKSAIWYDTVTDRKVIYGHARSLWGRSWSASEFGNDYFRIKLTYSNESSSSREIIIDHVQVRVFYKMETTTQNNSSKAQIYRIETKENKAIGYLGTQFYTREDASALPGNDNELSTQYSASEIVDVDSDDATRVGQTGSGYVIHQYKKLHVNNTAPITASWNGQTDVAPSTRTVYLQIYNRNSTTWENLDTDNTSSANTDFNMSGTQSDNLSNYYDANYMVSIRVYQQHGAI